MTDEQTAQAILMEPQHGHDKVALKQAIVRALQAARDEAGRDGVVAGHMTRKAPAGHIIDDAGVVRKVLGTLPVTADGVVVGTSARVWFNAYGGTQIISAVIEDSRKGWLMSPWCWSTKEAAEAAKEGKA